MSKTFGGYTLEQIISFASIPPNEAQQAITYIRTLEADNARLTAERDAALSKAEGWRKGFNEAMDERDARVVLPEIPPEHQVAVTHSQRDAQHFGDEHAYGVEWFRYADHLNEWESLISTNGPTPAAALEALRDKLKGQSDAH